MDNLTHTLFALTLANTGLRRVSSGATAALVIAANIPDAEFITTFTGGRVAYLQAHRGPTHGPGALLLAGLTAVIVWAVGRRARGEGPRPRFWPLLGVASLGVVGHVAMDFATSYGTRVLSPFSAVWFGVDWMPIVDLPMLVVLAAGLIAARIWTGAAGASETFGGSDASERRPYLESERRPYLESERRPYLESERRPYLESEGRPYLQSERHPYLGSETRADREVTPRDREATRRRARAAAIVLLLLAANYTVRAVLHAQAVAGAVELQQALEADEARYPPTVFSYLSRVRPAAMPAALPTEISPFRWRLVVPERSGFLVTEINLRQRGRGWQQAARSAGVWFPDDSGPLVERAAAAPIAQVFLNFSRFPAAEIVPHRNGDVTVHWYDLRFAQHRRPIGNDRRRHSSPFAAWVRLTPGGAVVAQGLGPG